MIAYETVWTGTLETAAIKARQRPASMLPPRAREVGRTTRQAVMAFLQAHPNASMLAILDHVGVPRSTVEGVIQDLRRCGRIEVQDNPAHRKGRKLYRLSTVQYSRSTGVEDQ